MRASEEAVLMKGTFLAVGKGAAAAIGFTAVLVGIGAFVITQSPKIERVRKNG